MNGGDLARALTIGNLFPFGETRVDQTSRELRRTGLLPLGGRGPYAAEISPSHAGNLLVGLTAPTTIEAPQWVIAWNAAKPSTGARFSDFCGCETFGEAFAHILEDWVGKLGVREVLIGTAWPKATITLNDGRFMEFGRPVDAEASGFRVTASYQQLRIPASALTHLALEIADHDAADDVAGGYMANRKISKAAEIAAAEAKSKRGRK